MSRLASESDRERPWNMYTSSNHNPPPLALATAPITPQRESDSSMSAISFGFAATAILISMFLIMAIFEHLFKPTQQATQYDLPRRSAAAVMQKHPVISSSETEDSRMRMYGFSVVMPGHRDPTHIAEPAQLPLKPAATPPRACSREGIMYWPQH